MFNKILKKIKPSKEEEKELKLIVNNLIKNIKIKNAKVILGGSLAKNTWLKNTHDIDLFVKFNYNKFKDKSHKLSNILEKSLKKFKPEKLHGSRDYFQIKFNNYTFEIVPILDIKNPSQARNITDISPLHSLWVKKYKKPDQIRLTKAFAHAQNIYGAESYIQGFSGYALEILTIYYGSFLNLIKSASKWKERTIIDPEKLLRNPLKELNKSKLNSPLILIDPVDKTRNVSAVLSKEKYNLFIKSCKSFLKNQSEEFFIKKQEKIPENSIVIEILPLKGKKDLIGSKLNSLFNKIKRQLVLEGYKIQKSNWIWNKKAYFWFKLKNNKLPEVEIIKGPPISKKEHLENFRKKHKNIFIKNNIAYVKKQREFTNAKDFIKNLIRQDYIKENLSLIRI